MEREPQVLYNPKPIDDIESYEKKNEEILVPEKDQDVEESSEEKEENRINEKEINDTISVVDEMGNAKYGSNPILCKPERQQYWLTKRDTFLEKAYSEIAPGIPLVNVRHKKLFLEKCKEYYAEMVKSTEKIKPIDRWDEYEIIRMFGKGLNPTSLKTALNNITYLVENIKPDGDTIRVIEFGPGSGWSTLMLKNALNEKYKDKKIQLYSVDLSPHSIVATQNSLDYYQIPWQTEVDIVDVSKIKGSDEYVNLITGDFIEFMKEQPDGYFDGFFSSHGTAYLSEDEYTQLLKVLEEKGKNHSMFVADSLDPMYTVKLDTLHLFLCSLSPSSTKGMPEYFYGKSVVSNSKYFAGQEVKKLIKVHNKESDLFYNWNHFLLSKGRIAYFLEMLTSIKVTTDVIDEYRDDVYPSYMVANIVKRENNSKWKVMTNLPGCPLYITNCGLQLENSKK